MRIYGHVGRHKLHILVECSSTYNFMDLNIAKKLGCQLISACPLQVEVAGGNNLISNYICKGFAWRCRGEEFETNVMLFSLGGCEMVLGIQWLSTLGNILNNFKEIKMEFKYNGKKILLRGTLKDELQWMRGSKMHIHTPKTELCYMVLCVYPTTTLHMLEAILGTISINSRLYRHPPTQKDVIKVMVRELLDTRVIRDNQRPFSSPVVMVKKKDGTWRMCIDYKKLNNATIKDKFPTPVIEEHIDELQG
ncbi:reverse transcriptase [Tanacetum coccineum]